jgi:drug/metabolite transporter (DMT)-like permease
VLNWLFYFLAVKYLPPAVAVTLTQGIGPVSMTALSVIRRRPVSLVTRACHTVTLAMATATCVYVIQHRVTNGPYDRGELAVAVAIAVICSISLTATLALSKTFAEAKIPASVVLSIRFPLLILTCLAILPTQEGVALTPRILGIVGAIALIGVATGAYLLQRGVELAPPLAVSTCLALSPLVVFTIDAVRSGTSINAVIFTLISTIVVVSVISIGYDGLRIRSAAVAAAGEPQPAQ